MESAISIRSTKYILLNNFIDFQEARYIKYAQNKCVIPGWPCEYKVVVE